MFDDLRKSEKGFLKKEGKRKSTHDILIRMTRI